MIYTTWSKALDHRNHWSCFKSQLVNRHILHYNNDIQLVLTKRHWLDARFAISRERDRETLGIFTGDLLIRHTHLHSNWNMLIQSNSHAKTSQTDYLVESIEIRWFSRWLSFQQQFPFHDWLCWSGAQIQGNAQEISNALKHRAVWELQSIVWPYTFRGLYEGRVTICVKIRRG